MLPRRFAVLALAVLSGCLECTNEGPQRLTTEHFTATYKRDVSGSCTGENLTTLQNWAEHAPGIAGFAPHAVTIAQQFPLFIYTVGTFGDYQSEEVMGWLEEMAARGFVAVSLEYDNGIPWGCGIQLPRAHCLYDSLEADSAVSRLCARPDVDCSLGIVTAGHSQGAMMALVAKNFDLRVRAAWMMGATCDYALNQTDGICNPAGSADEQCMLDVNTALAGDRVRIVNGDRDEYGDQAQYERITGKTCEPGALECLSDNGSGWYRIRSEDVEDFHGAYDAEHGGWGADHCFWTNSTDGQWCAGNDEAHPPDRNWLPPAALPWSLVPNLAWLASFANLPNLPQRIDSGATVSHADYVKDQRRSAGVSLTTADVIDISAPGAAPETIYRSQAEVAPSESELVYTLDDLGGGQLLVKLHFAELIASAVGERRFDVWINGTQVETDLDVFAAAGGARRALVRTYPAYADMERTITVTLANGSAGVAMVSAIEVVDDPAYAP